MEVHGAQVYAPYMSPHNHADCIGNDYHAVLSGEITQSFKQDPA